MTSLVCAYGFLAQKKAMEDLLPATHAMHCPSMKTLTSKTTSSLGPIRYSMAFEGVGFVDQLWTETRNGLPESRAGTNDVRHGVCMGESSEEPVKGAVAVGKCNSEGWTLAVAPGGKGAVPGMGRCSFVTKHCVLNS